MNALWYSEPKNFQVRDVPIPKCGDDDVLIKVALCGVCGTDQHIHNGGFNPTFPLIPGHEVVGTVAAIGSNVSPSDFEINDRVVADVSLVCGDCFYCRRGQPIACQSFKAKGIQEHGGFAQYVTFHKEKCFKIDKITDEEATLLEPASCAVHGLDKLKAPVGCSALMIGAGATGLILAQLLKHNGAAHVVLVANAGTKMDLAQKLGAADEYIPLNRSDPSRQWDALKEANPHGFDIVVEATGAQALVDRSIDYVSRGGTLLVYGVYDDTAKIKWSPARIFRDEIRVIGSFSQTLCFPRAIAYLESGRINVKGMVTHIFDIGEYGAVLEKLASRDCCKVAIRPGK